jgi:phenylpropionate dioxygenase-like ring-hydroxylating dioxygenase large terminal subunit
VLVTQEPELRAFWYPVAFVEDLVNGPLARRLLGAEVVLWKLGNGAIAGALDRCPHRDARLSGGWVEDGCLTCPYHGWQYGAEGKAVHIPQLSDGLPIPPAARLSSVRVAERYGVVWVALDEPVRPVPDLPDASQPGWRIIREFDEIWQASAPRLMDNSFDPAHIAFVHQPSFGTPDRARVTIDEVERTDFGLVLRNEMVVENPDVARHSTGTGERTTVRRSVTEYHAPFVRSLHITYPNGRQHIIITAATPVDDDHLQLVQWCVRNDTEEEAPTAGILAFDRQVTLEDKVMLESTWPDYHLDVRSNVHIKIDRPTVEIRHILNEICQGSWKAVSTGPRS